jgi:hypothetical protein
LQLHFRHGNRPVLGVVHNSPDAAEDGGTRRWYRGEQAQSKPQKHTLPHREASSFLNFYFYALAEA